MQTKGLIAAVVVAACYSQPGQARELKNLVNFAPCFPFCGGSDAGVSIDPSAVAPPPGTPSHTVSDGGSTTTVSGGGTSVVTQNGKTYVNGQLVSPAAPATTTTTASTPAAASPAVAASGTTPVTPAAAPSNVPAQ